MTGAGHRCRRIAAASSEPGPRAGMAGADNIENENRSHLMTALTLANIPSSINTYERLAVWVCQCLQSTVNGAEVNVVEGQASQPLAQAQLGFTADGEFRFILSAYIPCDQGALNSATAKTWMAAKDVSTAAPHTNLLSN